MRPGVDFPQLRENGSVFVVEADDVVRSALRFILEDHWETRAFASLDLALAKVVDFQPALILLGIGFVQTSGRSVLSEIVTQARGARILLMATSVSDPLAVAALEWGAHDVLGKPITFDAVHCKVDSLLGRRTMSLASIAPAESAVC